MLPIILLTKYYIKLGGSMINILDYIKNNILLCDGAMGTMLISKGWDMKASSEILNLNQEELIKEIHKEYINVGCKVINTNTFMCNIFNERKYSYNLEELITKSVLIAKEARGNKEVYISLSIGPSGAFFRNEKIGEDEIYNNFKRIVASGEKAGVDLIHLETFIHKRELEIALKAAHDSSSLPIFCTMSTIGKSNKLKDISLKDFSICAKKLGANAIGINCSNSPRFIENLVEEFLEVSELPIIVKPNTGYIEVKNKETLKENIEDYALNLTKFVNLGVKIIGGCCGTTPEYMKRIKEILK